MKPFLPNNTRRGGWLLLELLLASTVGVLVVGLGAIALFSLLDFKNDLWMSSLPVHNDFTRLILRLEQDQLDSDRVVAFRGSYPLESGNKWSSNTHGVHYTNGLDIDLWDLHMGIPVSVSTFKSDWAADNANYSTYSGSSDEFSSSGTDSEDSTYALVFLKGPQTILSIVYITYAEVDGNLEYTIERKANNGNRLVREDYINFTVEGFQRATTAANNDQQDAGDSSMRWVTIYQEASGDDPTTARAAARFPVALNRGARDIKTGQQSQMLKQLNDWIFYFAPGNGNRWIVN